MPECTVTPISSDRFRVVVSDAGSSTTHIVTVRGRDVERYAEGCDARGLVEASFRFLLDRETKESILSEFDLSVIERFFPEYPRVIRSLLS